MNALNESIQTLILCNVLVSELNIKFVELEIYSKCGTRSLKFFPEKKYTAQKKEEFYKGFPQ